MRIPVEAVTRYHGLSTKHCCMSWPTPHKWHQVRHRLEKPGWDAPCRRFPQFRHNLHKSNQTRNNTARHHNEAETSHLLGQKSRHTRPVLSVSYHRLAFSLDLSDIYRSILSCRLFSKLHLHRLLTCRNMDPYYDQQGLETGSSNQPCKLGRTTASKKS